MDDGDAINTAAGDGDGGENIAAAAAAADDDDNDDAAAKLDVMRFS